MTTRQLISTTCTNGGIALATYTGVFILFSTIGLFVAPSRHYQRKAIDLMALSFGGAALSAALITTGHLTEDD